MCPCCGFEGLKGSAYESLPADTIVRGGEPPYSVFLGMPSYEVCPCCGYEFGFDDEPGTSEPQSFEQYLADWTRKGCKWFDENNKPIGWSIENQIKGCRILNLAVAFQNPIVDFPNLAS